MNILPLCKYTPSLPLTLSLSFSLSLSLSLTRTNTNRKDKCFLKNLYELGFRV
jgi:hypothetical protein